MKPDILPEEIESDNDVVVTWLLQWADEECAQHDAALHTIAQDFVRLLLDGGPEYPIKKVVAERNFATEIHIWAEVNEQYFIAITDGIPTDLKRLESGKAIAEAHCREKQWPAPKLICLETINASLNAANNIRTLGYKVIYRKDMLEILNKSSVINDIFRQLVEYWAAIEAQTNSFHKFEHLKYNEYAVRGFFLELQSRIGGSDWGYPRSGGWLRFRIQRQGLPELGEFYIQIDIDRVYIGQIDKIWEYNIELNIEINKIISVPALHQVFSEIEPFAEKYGLTICEPEEFENKSSDLDLIDETAKFESRSPRFAIVNAAFRETENGDFDFGHFLKTWGNLEKTIEAYCLSKKE